MRPLLPFVCLLVYACVYSHFHTCEELYHSALPLTQSSIDNMGPKYGESLHIAILILCDKEQPNFAGIQWQPLIFVAFASQLWPF